ncbi:DNA translocase FtsK [Paenibacillus sp. GSMTC-2017]|nr:DNA translocase FtsK [Paenibacillus sp. GSMTC-2017]
MLFGYYGALIIAFVMFAIAIMLITGKSYVQLMGVVKKRFVSMVKLLLEKRNSIRKRRAATAAALKVQHSSDNDNDDDSTIDDDEQYIQKPVKKRKSIFFAWKQGSTEVKDQDGQEEWIPSHNDRDTLSGVKPAWEVQSEQSWEKTGVSIQNDYPNKQLDDETPPWEEGFTKTDLPLHKDTDNSDHTRSNEQDWDGALPENRNEELENETELVDEYPLPITVEDDEITDTDTIAGSINEEDSVLAVDAIPRRPIAVTNELDNKTKPYRLPPFTLLEKPIGLSKGTDATDMYDSRRKLEATLESFGVRATVLDVVRGPAVTRYEVQPATGVKVSRIVGLTDDIALALAAKDIRMEAPIPGKSAIGIEVPNMEVSVVTMREVMETPAFQNSQSKLSIAFGRDISGQTIVGNLARMPHLLVAGATGSGKSVCINGIITSILYKANPDEVKFLMIDPKMVELNVYNGIPHLLAPVVTDPRRASLALKKIVVEMEKRYELFSKSATRNIEGYNTLMADNPAAVLPYIVVIVDELADLMMVAANDVEDSIARLAQMARAAGIHLIIATQRPSVDVITGVIKANIPSRIAFGVSSQVDSRTILDMAGAEKLLGRGDMLFLPVGMSKPIRVQGAFLSDQEVEVLVAFARDQAEAVYKEDLVPEVEEESTDNEPMLDELYDQAVQIVVEAKQASVSLLQRRMRIGYTRAARLIDQMEAKSIIGPYEGSKPREVLMSLEQFQAGKLSS